MLHNESQRYGILTRYFRITYREAAYEDELRKHRYERGVIKAAEKAKYAGIFASGALVDGPDGRKIRVGDFKVDQKTTYRMSQDEKLTRRLGGLPAEKGLFAAPDSDPPTPLQGDYQLVIDTVTFEDGTETSRPNMCSMVRFLAGPAPIIYAAI